MPLPSFLRRSKTPQLAYKFLSQLANEYSTEVIDQGTRYSVQVNKKVLITYDSKTENMSVLVQKGIKTSDTPFKIKSASDLQKVENHLNKVIADLRNKPEQTELDEVTKQVIAILTKLSEQLKGKLENKKSTWLLTVDQAEFVYNSTRKTLVSEVKGEKARVSIASAEDAAKLASYILGKLGKTAQEEAKSGPDAQVK